MRTRPEVSVSPIVLPSVIDRVTAHPTHAHIVRKAVLPDATGATTVRLLDLPLLLRSGSLRARVDGAGRLVRFDEVADLDVDAGDGPDPGELEAAVHRAEAEVRRLTARVRAHTQVTRILQQPLFEDHDETAAMPDVAALHAIVDVRDHIVDHHDTRADTLRIELRTANRGLERARHALAVARDGTGVRALRGLEAEVERTGPGPATLVVDYFVDGVRWAPAYTLEVDGEQARLAMRAHIAQATGEAWTDAALAVSTVQVNRSTLLPKLAAWRIGRSQPAVSTGWRPLPSDLPTLFRNVDAAGHAPPPASPVGQDRLTTLRDDLETLLTSLKHRPDAPVGSAVEHDTFYDEDDDYDEVPAPMEGAAPPPPSAPMPAAPMAMAADIPAPKKRARGRPAKPKPPGAPPRRTPRPGPPDPGALLDYGWLRLPDWSDRKRRGGLHPVTLDSALSSFVEERGLGAGTVRSVSMALSHLRKRQRTLGRARLTAGLTDSQQAGFHHRTPFGPRITLPADGRFRGVQVQSATAKVVRAFRVVPRQDTVVQEILEFQNPTDGPLGDGPIRVLEGGGVRTTTTLTGVATGGPIRVSLGPEERLRVARNADMQEETRGMLGGDRVLMHRIEVTIANRLPRAARVEVFEALPDDSEDTGVEVRLDPSEPPPEQGTDPTGRPNPRALRWRITIPAGAERRIRWGYSITISSRAELEGGNRREP